ncbi:MAG: response regulator [Thiotrichales bacterium]|jgi:DNA-binding response OmpR family regulator|nr:response regulator [Thiotrichales bacterium]MBT4151485.1 response regulator [Thiotrichales bacterium]MBT4574477.1 response regulator [Thiotrichales bacterium]MBT4972617.1 response regulator [Thiotrichales bacterium]MBT5290553.1 response regulator [Thiotrichales bacterium]
MSDKNKILVVDDDKSLRDLLCRYLKQHGFEVDAAEDGVEMDRVLESFTPDLLILDLMLPGEDGLSIARRLHHSSSSSDAVSKLPIIILSAKGDEVDRIVGLEVGADDYLAKPFNPRELLARVRSILRRINEEKEIEQMASGKNSITFGEYIVNLDNYSLSHNGDRVEITSGEFELLRHLLENRGRVMSRDHLLDILEIGAEEAFDRSIDVRIARIRKKIEKDSQHPEFIKTVRGVGYLFTTDNMDSSV